MPNRITIFISSLLTLMLFVFSSVLINGQVPTNGLVAYYPFNGNANDGSGSVNNGTIHGSPQLVDDRFGNYNSAYYFNGSSDYINCPTNNFPIGNQSRSISLWIKSPNMAVGNKMLVGWGSPHNYEMSALALGRGNIPNRQVMYWGWGDDFNMSSTLNDNTWYHIVYTFENGVGSLYLNGKLDETYNASPQTPSGTNFYIANFTTVCNNFNGTIDDIRVYNRALSQGEVDALFGEDNWTGNVDLSNGLVAYYPFDGDASDQSGNGNNGTTNGGCSWVTGKVGQSCSFDGTGYINIPNSSTLQIPSNQMTISTWINISGVPNGNVPIICKSDNPDIPQYTLNFHGPKNHVAFGVRTSTGLLQANFDYVFNYNEWYFVAITWDGSVVTLYINNNIVLSKNLAATMLADNNPLEIGRDVPGATEYFQGMLDNLRIYDRALNGQEISALYNEGGGGDNSNSISGFVNDQGVDLNIGTVIKQGLVANVELYDQSNALINTVQSDNSGSFIFTGLQSGTPYRIEISKSGVSSSGKDYTEKAVYKNIQSSTSNSVYTIPYTLVGQVNSYADSLKNLKVPADLLYGLISTEISIKGFDNKNIDELLQNWQVIDTNIVAKTNSLARLLLEEKALKDMFYDASSMNIETLNSIVGLGSNLVSMYLISNKLKSIPVIGKIAVYIVKLSLELNKAILDFACSKIPPPNGPIIHSRINTLFDLLLTTVDPNVAINELVKSIVYPTGSKLFMGDLYIPRLNQPFYDWATNKTTNFEYSGDFTQAFNKNLEQVVNDGSDSKIEISHNNTMNAKNLGETFRNASGIVATASDITSAAAAITAATGVGATVASVLTTISTALKAVSVASGVAAIYTTGSRLVIFIPYDLNNISLSLYNPVLYKMALTNQANYSAYSNNESLVNMSKSTNDYNDLLYGILNDLKNGKRDMAFEKIDSLIVLDSIVTTNTNYSLYPIYSTETLMDTTNVKLKNLFNSAADNVGYSYINRTGVLLNMLALKIDSTNSVYLDSVNNIISETIAANDSMVNSISNLNAQTSNLPSIPLLTTFKYIVPEKVNINENFNIVLHYKNFGGTKTQNLKAILSFDNGFTVTQDTIILNDLSANQEDSIYISVSAPAFDTTGNYTVYYYSDNGTSIPLTGTIQSFSPTKIDGLNHLPTKYSLSNNYPNPFNPTTNIKYSIPKTSLVILKVYNVMGQEVNTLVDEEKAPGTYEVMFNAKNLSSGIYFYTIKAGDFIQTKKMILLK